MSDLEKRVAELELHTDIHSHTETMLAKRIAELERKFDVLQRAYRAKCELIDELLEPRQPEPVCPYCGGSGNQPTPENEKRVGYKPPTCLHCFGTGLKDSVPAPCPRCGAEPGAPHSPLCLRDEPEQWDDWKPIDTAPLGTPILAWPCGPADDALVYVVTGWLYRGERRWTEAGGEGYWEVRPTHWMEIPPAPDSAPR